MDGSEAATPKRKKSQKRQRDKQIKTPLTADEFNRVAARASAAGLSFAAFSRLKMLDETGARSQRKISLDMTLVGKLIGQLGYYGNNINQTAYELHAFGERALAQDFDARKTEIDEIIDYLLELTGRPPRPKTA